MTTFTPCRKTLLSTREDRCRQNSLKWSSPLENACPTSAYLYVVSSGHVWPTTMIHHAPQPRTYIIAYIAPSSLPERSMSHKMMDCKVFVGYLKTQLLRKTPGISSMNCSLRDLSPAWVTKTTAMLLLTMHNAPVGYSGLDLKELASPSSVATAENKTTDWLFERMHISLKNAELHCKPGELESLFKCKCANMIFQLCLTAWEIITVKHQPTFDCRYPTNIAFRLTAAT